MLTKGEHDTCLNQQTISLHPISVYGVVTHNIQKPFETVSVILFFPASSILCSFVIGCTWRHFNSPYSISQK